MARDLSMYMSALEPAGADLEASDERLIAIIDLFDKREFIRAADAAEGLAAEGVFDIRPLSYLLFVTFREEGIAVLRAIFDVVGAALGVNLQAIGPRKNQEAFFAKRLGWLWTTISDHLAYYRKESGAEWKKLRENVTSASLAEILDKAKAVGDALTSPAHEKTATTLGTLTSSLRTLAEELAMAEAASRRAVNDATSAAPENDEDKGVEDDEEGATADEFEANDAERASVANTEKIRNRTMKIDVSPPFAEFLAKLRAFEKLVDKGELLKAAIVADDVQNIIENFDPRLYFPVLLSRFSELLSSHAETLGEHIENRDSFAWKTMAQFYRVDLDKFQRG